ncbi:MAG: lysylphosphatidylglycerol synthase transmembrane domain-containing protein [Candidatus Saccharimonadales bacterium]
MKFKVILTICFLGGLLIAARYASIFFSSNSLTFTMPSHLSQLAVIALLMFAVVLQVSGHFLRAYKSKYLIRPIREARTGVLFRGLAIGYLFNALLPFRLGEIVRTFYLGDKLLISRTAAFISIIIERIVDGGILGSILLASGWIIRNRYPAAAMLLEKSGLIFLFVASVLAALILLMRSENPRLLKSVHVFTGYFNDKIRDRLRLVAWSGIYSSKLMLSRQAYRKRYLSLSILMWLLYLVSSCLVAVVCLPAAHHFLEVWFAGSSAYIGVGAPAGPGYVGTFHIIVTELLNALKLTNTGAYTLFVWLLLIAPISLVGLAALFWRDTTQDSSKNPNESRIHKLRRDIDISSEFSNFLDAYLQDEEINHLLTQAELDDRFKLVRSFKGGSNAYTMLVWQNEELRVKKITLPQYAEKLSDQAVWLKTRSHLPHLPRFVGEEHAENYYSFDVGYLEDYTPFFDFIHSNNEKKNNKVIDNLLEFMRSSIYTLPSEKDHPEDLKKYIDSKVVGKVNDAAAMNVTLDQLLSAKFLKINGKSYLNLLYVIEKIRAHKAAMQELAHYAECEIHGDLTIDNLITSPTGDFIVIDPNNENQISAPAVDYGKLYQSLHSGYEFLIQLEECKTGTDSVKFEDSKSKKYADLFAFLDKKLRKELSPAEYRSILFHEAVHYCRMLTYRANINPATLPVFYAVATKLFNDFLGQYSGKK